MLMRLTYAPVAGRIGCRGSLRDVFDANPHDTRTTLDPKFTKRGG